MKKKYTVFTLLFMVVLFTVKAQNATSSDYYQLTIYHCKDASQEMAVHHYLEKAHVPALHKMGLSHIGVFVSNDSLKQHDVYVVTPSKSLDTLANLNTMLLQNGTYIWESKNFREASYKNPNYERLEVILLKAFDDYPSITTPALTSARADRVYELRSYESSSWNYHINKVKMFNKGDEISIFKQLQFHPVFFASVISGSHMPNLMYLTAHDDMKAREAHWNAFGNDAKWKDLSGQKYYQNNVSHINITFLHPTSYSDL
ncbi:NIPSNAP family protein [Zhouia sp. PK063]|uniref:NIPSNAP family protein n=1 Tax=Zhouia sp. PK063 TaxID=3373602 RepID=UPI00379B0199